MKAVFMTLIASTLMISITAFADEFSNEKRSIEASALLQSPQFKSILSGKSKLGDLGYFTGLKWELGEHTAYWEVEFQGDQRCTVLFLVQHKSSTDLSAVNVWLGGAEKDALSCK